MAEEKKPLLKTEGKIRSKAPQPFIAHPLREAEPVSEPQSFRGFYSAIASHFPSLRRQLVEADMRYTPAGFVRHSLLTALYITSALLLITYLLVRSEELWLLILLLLLPLYYAGSFFYAMQFPRIKARIRAKRIEQELVFAGRHMLIELKGGVPLFDAMLGISRDYGEVSTEFNKVVEKVTLGVPLGVALHDVAETNPSPYFKRVVLQIANSLASGSDVTSSLEAVLDQISKEQVIELKAYGQKLNPIVMFFMIFGIILPSLGVAFVIILSSFLGGASFAFGSSALFGILVAVGLIQFIFLSMVESSRPKFDIV
ncbi:MAG: type II secretion system F family protein [Candidatus Micrarchaeota archaeon]|nr:type II secretion system F family protein [Candidatus Micrarchaeota archaeon]